MKLEEKLQHMCESLIALRLYHEDDIQVLVKNADSLPKVDDYEFHFDRHELWKKIEILAKEKLHSLPKKLQINVVNLLHSIDEHVKGWELFHSFIAEANHGFPIEIPLYWKMDGTINREFTAKKFIENENLDLKTRFIMACVYFMEDEIFHLWNNNKKRLAHIDTNLHINDVVRFWIQYMEEGARTHWSQFVGEYFRNTSSVTRLRISCFFHFLSQENREHYFIKFAYKGSHGDDFQNCLNQMDENEYFELFKLRPRMLVTLLTRPYQNYFIDMANRLWSHMDAKDFLRVLSFLLDGILLGKKDYDYLELLREYWKFSPSRLRKKARKEEKLFKATMELLNYKGKTKSMSSTEVVDEIIRLKIEKRDRYNLRSRQKFRAE